MACDRPNFKKPQRKHTFMTSTQKGLLKIAPYLWISFFLNNRPIIHCADGEIDGSFVGHFFWTS